jgi:hypothetical protein
MNIIERAREFVESKDSVADTADKEIKPADGR